MRRRKPPMPFGDFVRSLDLDAPTAPEAGSRLKGGKIPTDFQLSSLLPVTTVEDFTDGMLRAVKELNQNPELLKEVSKRIS